MLIIDENIAKQLEILTHISNLLQRASVPQSVKGYSPELLLLSRQRSSAGGDLPSLITKEQGHSRDWLPTADPKSPIEMVRDMTELVLPRSTSPDVIRQLVLIGKVMEETQRQLKAYVDVQLVDFYTHVQRKASPGFEFPIIQSCNRTLDERGVTTAVRSLATPPVNHLDGRYTDVSNAFSKSKGKKKENEPLQLLPLESGRDEESTVDPAISPSFLPSVPQNFITRARDAPTRTSMACRLADQRNAARELQSFLYLILEAALYQSGATSAAVYINFIPPPVTIVAKNNWQESLATSITGHSETPSATRNGGREEYLSCVAHINGNFPLQVNYSSNSVLTTVAATNVAVNLNYSEFQGGAADGIFGGVPMEAESNRVTEGGGPGLQSLLSLHNGVVVPMKPTGCLVLANKWKSTNGVSDGTFSRLDEHVAWSAALLCGSVLRRYDQQLLLQCRWAPSCITALKPFIKENIIATNGLKLPSGIPKKSQKRHMHGVSTKRIRSNAAIPTVEVAGLGCKATWFKVPPEASDAAAASLIFHPKHDVRSSILTIVRTADRKLTKALQQQINSAAADKETDSNPSHSGAALDYLNDEDLFQEASQYINNLESLWQKSIGERHAMHTIVRNYNRIIDSQEEKITHLELRVRQLNTQIVELEHRIPQRRRTILL